MRKKVVFLPYDFDTAIGINNEGSLVFSYNLEDTDQVDGANVFNGQDSVLWCNLRDTFANEIEAMYKQLRSDGILSYSKVEQQFEDHQNKWPEALFNEDAKFKYLDPLENDNDATYLPMLQGSKAEQRKWWLFNRFRYMDSKFNAGDALTDYIQLRGYAKGNITITPYADVYPTIKYGSYLVRTRGERNQSYELECPLSDMNDTEIYIYSASALSSIGDISALKVGLADFSRANKLTNIKIGDSTSGYSNPNLKTLTLGNNTLLQAIDVRNCTNLGTDTQKTIDLSGCTGLEEAYFDGTSISGLDLPNGGVLKKLHLPGTITYLTIRNHTDMTEFVCPDFSNITTLWLENPASVIDTEEIVNEMAAGSRIRLYNFHWEMDDLSDVILMFDKLDTMRGLDQNGNNTQTAQVYGTIHAETASQAQIDMIRSRYSDVTVTYDTLVPTLIYKSEDGSQILYTEAILNGGNGTKLLPDDKASTVQYTYTPAGWSLSAGGAADANALSNVTSDRIVYAVYTQTVNTYPITFVRGAEDGNDTIAVINIAYGQTAAYTGSNPTSTRGNTYSFIGWTPELATVTGPATYTAEFRAPITVTYLDYDGTQLGTENVRYNGTAIHALSPTRTNTAQYSYSFAGWGESASGSASSTILNNLQENKTVYAIYTATIQSYTITFVKASEDGGGTLQSGSWQYGALPTYNGNEPVSSRAKYEFTGWTPAIVAVTGNATYTAVFRNTDSPTRTFIARTIDYAESPNVTEIGSYAFMSCGSLKTASFPSATSIGNSAFAGCFNLDTISFPAVTSIGTSAFFTCSKLTTAYFPAATSIGNFAFQGCSSLTTVSFPVATSIGSSAFQNCSNLTTASFPVATSIGGNAFRNCSKLTTASFPVATSIGNSAFQFCPSLTTVSFPSVTSIGMSAFQNCSNLTTASFPVATSIGMYAFAQCFVLTTASFPVATSIVDYAFQYCSSLTTAYFPAATSIGNSAFQDCSKLTTFVLGASSVASLANSNAFSNANSAIFYVPDSLVTAYQAATNWSYFSSRIKGINELEGGNL